MLKHHLNFHITVIKMKTERNNNNKTPTKRDKLLLKTATGIGPQSGDVVFDFNDNELTVWAMTHSYTCKKR